MRADSLLKDSEDGVFFGASNYSIIVMLPSGPSDQSCAGDTACRDI